ALEVGDVIDAEGGRGVVVGDRADTLAVGNGGVDRRAEVDVEGLVGLEGDVAADLDGDRLGRVAGEEGQVAGLALVVAAGAGHGAGRRVVRGGEVDRGVERGGTRLGDGEDVVRGTRVALEVG